MIRELNCQNNQGGMDMFGPGILICGGLTIVVALADRIAEDCGIEWIGTTLKILVPIVALAASVYFLQTNAIVGWLR